MYCRVKGEMEKFLYYERTERSRYVCDFVTYTHLIRKYRLGVMGGGLTSYPPAYFLFFRKWKKMMKLCRNYSN